MMFEIVCEGTHNKIDMKFNLRDLPLLAVSLAGFLLPALARAQVGEQGRAAEILAKGLYCNTFDVLSGDVGLILGLLVGFIGFLILIFKQLHATGIILILAGVALTALPAFFESTFSGVSGMAAQSGIGNQTFDTFLQGRQSLGGCEQYRANLTFIEEGILLGDADPQGNFGETVTLPDGTVIQSIDGLIDDVLRREGGYVNHPDDRGGPTNYGITQATLSEYLGRPATIADVQNLAVSTARQIYRNQYAPSDSIPSHLRAAAFDSNVNHGRGGGNTIYNNAVSAAGGGVPSNSQYINARADYYRGIISRDPSQRSFAAGWTNRLREFGYDGPPL